MKAASINDLKKQLNSLDPESVLELFIRVVKYKKENKELLTYLIYEASDESNFIQSVKDDMDIQFEEMNKTNFYYAKKSIRKILRTTNKFIRYSGIAETQVELLIYFCNKIKETGLKLERSTALNNIYLAQIKKINKAISTMHEDLQYDYKKAIPED